MIVTVKVKLNVDPDAYFDEYGVPMPEIAADLQKHCQTALIAHFEQIGILQ